MNRLCVVVLGLFEFLVSGQSPCPGVFDYQNNGGNVFGVIRLQPNGPVNTLTTRVNFTIAARLPSVSIFNRILIQNATTTLMFNVILS